MMHNKATQTEMEEEEWELKTLVLWHINSCPIPSGYDPHLVGPRIKSALKSSGRSSDRITITAIGNLKDFPGGDDVLSSTGISLIQTDVQSELFTWTMDNRPPGTIMLISDPLELELQAPALGDLVSKYTFLLAYPRRALDSEWLSKSFMPSVDKEWLWESLLTADSSDDKLETRSSETGECPSQDFTTYLKGFARLDENMESDSENDDALTGKPSAAFEGEAMSKPKKQITIEDLLAPVEGKPGFKRLSKIFSRMKKDTQSNPRPEERNAVKGIVENKLVW